MIFPLLRLKSKRMKIFPCHGMSAAASTCLALILVAATATGCKEKPVAVAPIPVEQVPATMEQAFQQAAPAVKQDATAVVAALQGQDEPKAFFELQELSGRPELTPEQQEAVTRAWAAVHARLRAAAERGDKKAGDALEQYRATK